MSEQYCLHVPPITLISVFSQLPLLQSLRIWGVPSTAIPSIMACLPNLIVLDTDYLQYGNYPFPSTPLPHLQQLTIRTSPLPASGSDELWNWTCSLIPHEGSLQSFSLVSFEIEIPLSFITRLIRRHGAAEPSINPTRHSRTRYSPLLLGLQRARNIRFGRAQMQTITPQHSLLRRRPRRTRRDSRRNV